jgi:hypothetical protein
MSPSLLAKIELGVSLLLAAACGVIILALLAGCTPKPPPAKPVILRSEIPSVHA